MMFDTVDQGHVEDYSKHELSQLYMPILPAMSVKLKRKKKFWGVGRGVCYYIPEI